MILSAHSDAAYLNVPQARSRAGAHIILYEDNPVTSNNWPILTIAQIIKNVMSSAAEAELSGLFICAKAMIPLRNTLLEMGWPQPPSPVQCDNSTATGVTNKTMVNNRPNHQERMSMDLSILFTMVLLVTPVAVELSH